jgi:oxygen-dependent protoporphyrinogen oxidase
VDVVVVGGGIAGLAAAWYLRERDVLVLEARPRVGGRLLSERRGDYWLNYGAHVFGGPGTATGHLLDELAVEAAPVPGCLAALAMNGKLLTDERVETYPFRIPMANDARFAVLRAGIKVRAAVWRYGRVSATRPGETAAERQQRIYEFLGDRTFSEFVGPLPADADAMFRPTVSRSAGSPEQISAGAGVGYFQLVWDRSAGLSRNIVGGSSMLPEAIWRALGQRVLLGAEAHDVEVMPDGVTVRYEHDGAETEVRARDVVLATPAPITRDLVRSWPPGTAAALDQVVYGSYVSAAFLTNETAPQPWDGCYAIATPKRRFNVMFNMTSLARSTEPARRPGSSIMVFSPAQLADDLLDLDDEQILAKYLEDLDDLFAGFSGLVTEAHVERWPLGLAYCFPGRGRIQAALTTPLERLHLAGDYLGTLYTETAISSGLAAAARIRALRS